jgi:hypothetical protein
MFLDCPGLKTDSTLRGPDTKHIILEKEERRREERRRDRGK